jgi:hypothetical protein
MAVLKAQTENEVYSTPFDLSGMNQCLLPV